MNLIKSSLFLISIFISSWVQANVPSFFEQIKNDPNALYAFFKSMPKGGELHYHLSGGIYPETMLKLAATDNYCFNKITWTINKNNTPHCDGVSIQDLFNQPELFFKVVKIWSMKDFVPGKESSHDHFFNTFYKFNNLVIDYQPKLVANVLQKAAQQQEHYLELMLLPDNGHALNFGHLVKNAFSLAQKREILLEDREFQKNIDHTVSAAEQIKHHAYKQLGCKTHFENAACQVNVKFLYFSLRENPFDNLFAQTLNAFEAVSRSQKNHGVLVGVNLVQPENGIISSRDYHKQMLMYHYFHKLYPTVNIALHAGEITQELATPEDLNDHVHEALFTGQAQRIGHGVDIAYEHNVEQTLNFMATHQKAVEINLTSNERILNVSGRNHPLNYYLQHKVPVVLSTDDEGILRTNLSLQYVKAVLEHGLDYLTLKQINRNALTYAFLPGKSIWADANKAQLVKECENLNSTMCSEFTKTSEKAQLQWNLEQKLIEFENKFGPTQR